MPLQGVGAAHPLSQPLTAFFASRRCPGAAIRAGTDWALTQARAKQAVVSGFHSLLEQSALKLLLQAKSPVVVVIARPIKGARLDAAWLTAIMENRMVVVSSHTASGRLSKILAAERNDVAALMANRIVIAHADPSGTLGAALARWRSAGADIELLSGCVG